METVTKEGCPLVIRRASSDADLETWRRVRLAVVPYERAATVDEMRSMLAREPTRLLLLAEIDGTAVGSGLVGESSLGPAGVHPRILPSARRRGIGTALHRVLVDHARATGFDEAVAYADDPPAEAFATRLGYREVDRQVEQVRDLSANPPSDRTRPSGFEFVSVAERPELLEAAFPLAAEGYDDMATFRPVRITLEEWLEQEASHPGGSFVALADDEIVGFSGLCRNPDDPSVAEDGLTVVRRDWRRRGLATALKEAELQWAASNGIRLVTTWTQTGNEGMRSLNERLGFVQRHVSLTMLAEIR